MIHVKYLPSSWEPYCAPRAANTVVLFVSEETIIIDSKSFTFPLAIVEYEDLRTISEEYISSAFRDELGDLWVELIRFYTGARPAWDTGDYHEVHP